MFSFLAFLIGLLIGYNVKDSATIALVALVYFILFVGAVVVYAIEKYDREVKGE